ncbi:MAG TPA: YbhB/YbcL family Raf kinase inhibitor-like protein [Actinocrinis sp.]|nr:YbhB/YbcL family Raf kinase inhibitor-like protein [Actinocrinis sp.]
MGIMGTLLKNKHADEAALAWNMPALAGPETLELRSDDFPAGGTMPTAHAGKRAGGANISPALAWNSAPAETAQLLLVIEDVDAPTKKPFVHCVALIDPEVTAVPAGELNSASPTAGVQILRSGMGRGYHGPEPIKGHGPHRYVFQVFALSAPVTTADAGDLTKARPRAVLAAVSGRVLARGRVDGIYER